MTDFIDPSDSNSFSNDLNDEPEDTAQKTDDEIKPPNELSNPTNNDKKTLKISRPELSESVEIYDSAISCAPPLLPLIYHHDSEGDVDIQPNYSVLITTIHSTENTEIQSGEKIENKEETNNNIINNNNTKRKHHKHRFYSDSQKNRNLDREDVKFSLEKLIQKQIIPDSCLKNDCIALARQECVLAMLKEDYDRANDLEKAISVLIRSLQNDDKSYENEKETNDLKSRLEAAKTTQKEIEERWNEIIQQQKAIEEQRRETMIQQHENDVRKFQEKWERPESMLPFTKPSTELLQIRKMQKAYAIAHDFVNAKAMKMKADRFQKVETELAQRKAAQAMRIEYEQLLERHRKEKEAGEMNWKRKLETLEIEKVSELKANEILKKQLTCRIDSPNKLKKRKAVMLPIVENKSDSIFTHKTRRRYAEYKKSPEKMRLDVKMDTKNIVKPKASSGTFTNGRKTPRKRMYES